MGKSPLFSKTLWLNLLGSVALLLQGEVGYLLPPQYQAIGLLVANLGLRLITREPLDWSKVKVTGLGCWLLLLAGLGLTTAGLFSGCATARLFDSQPVLTELTVRVAAGRVLDENPGWVAPARDITADAIRLVTETDQVTLAGLEAYVLQQIPWQKLTVEEEELLRVLVHAVRVEIEAELARQGVTAPDEVRVQVARVLGWIYQSADSRSQRSGLQGRAGAASEAEDGPVRTALFGPGFDAEVDAAVERAARAADARMGL